jgi:Tol biopolymer transport system component
VAQPFNPGTGAFDATPVHVAEQVLFDPSTWRGAFSAAGESTLAYVTGGAAANQLTWYDRSGKVVGATAEKTYNFNHVRLSPDGLKVAGDPGESLNDIWVYDVARNVGTRLTFEGSQDAPIWSPDGKWIAHNRLENGHFNIYRKPANGMGQAELLLEGDQKNVTNWPTDWSPDGKSLLYAVGDLVGAAQIWELPLTGNERKPRPLMPSSFMTLEARFSPDGRWIAYTSNESGRFEVYVIPSSIRGGKWQISISGGDKPVWRRDGKELFYLTSDSNLMSVSISLGATSVEVGAAHRLFTLAGTVTGGIGGLQFPYDVTPDGKRFVIVTAEQTKIQPITLVTNWTAELKK